MRINVLITPYERCKQLWKWTPMENLIRCCKFPSTSIRARIAYPIMETAIKVSSIPHNNVHSCHRHCEETSVFHHSLTEIFDSGEEMWSIRNLAGLVETPLNPIQTPKKYESQNAVHRLFWNLKDLKVSRETLARLSRAFLSMQIRLFPLSFIHFFFFRKSEK